jgi:outer membrane protein TolC
MRFVMQVAPLVVMLMGASALDAQQAPDTVRLTLEEAVRRSLELGEEMRTARAQVSDARGQIREATADALPEVRGSVVYTRQFASIFQDVGADSTFGPIFANSPFGAANAWNLEVTIRQTLFAAGKVGAGMRAARAYRTASEEQLVQTQADLTYQVRRAYFDALYASRLVEIAVAGLDQARAHEQEVQRFRLAGTRAEYDLLRAHVDAANQEPIVVTAQNGLDLTLLALKRLVNLPADAPLVLTTRLDSDDATIPVLASDSSVAGPERASVRAAEATVGVWEEAVRAARADRWPSLSVGATFSHQAFPQEVSPFDAQFRRSWVADVRLSVPIFLGFRTYGTEERARASLERARAERDEAREMAALEVERAAGEVRRAEALLAAQRATVRQAGRAYRIATVRYTNGMSTQLEVSDARLLAQRAEVNEAQALRDYLVGLAELERALGRPAPVERRRVDDVLGPISVRGQER